tara:strand:+ start:30796 stop:31959 length:1164 start_codon:yes stop_codon:yes gene_type:complete
MENKRRYDIDQLRVIAILAVYFHHIGMPFNGDKFHIMNGDASKILDDIMVFFEQFRLPLLFLISGTGTMFAFSKRTWWQFVKERNARLLIPFFFGVVFIVPPQTYFEFMDAYSSYFQIYEQLDFRVNHLWFIWNLFIISMAVIPLILFLKSAKAHFFIHRLEVIGFRKFGVLLWVLPLIIITLILKKYYPTDEKNISNLSSTFFYGYYFIAGMVLATSKHIWGYLKAYRKFNFITFIVCSILFYGYYYLPSAFISPYLSIPVRWSIWYVVSMLVGWTLVITLLGYAQIWFTKNSTLLKKSNEAIYPFYILHQTVIIVLAYYIVQLEMSIPVKMIVLIFTSFPLIIIIYRFLIYPFKIPRILFGMKNKKIMAQVPKAKPLLRTKHQLE